MGILRVLVCILAMAGALIFVAVFGFGMVGFCKWLDSKPFFSRHSALTVIVMVLCIFAAIFSILK